MKLCVLIIALTNLPNSIELQKESNAEDQFSKVKAKRSAQWSYFIVHFLYFSIVNDLPLELHNSYNHRMRYMVSNIVVLCYKKNIINVFDFASVVTVLSLLAAAGNLGNFVVGRSTPLMGWHYYYYLGHSSTKASKQPLTLWNKV